MKSNVEISIITVGKLKEDYLRKAQEIFLKAIGSRIRIRMIEVKDEKTKENASEKELSRVKNQEGAGIMKHLDLKGKIIAMDISGKKTSSEMLSKILSDEWADETKIQFVIGGSLGISDEVLSLAHKRVSFGPMTYPHQLFRVMLLEELTKTI